MNDVVKRQWSLGLLWIIVVLLVGSTAFIGWKLREVISGNNRADLTLALEAQKKEIASLSQTIQRHDQQFQQLADHGNKMAENVKILDQNLREGNPAWRYAQIQFYLERAAQETFVMKDPLAARTWLQAALQTVNTLNEANLLPIQESIQQDIQDLTQTGGSAISQAMISLSVLSDGINALPHKQAPEKLSTNTDTVPSEKDDWRTAMKAGWNDLKSLVRVRTATGEIVPYFSKDENMLINQNVSLVLSQASFSAMRSEENLYAQEVAQATEWIKRYYDPTSPAVQEALTTLDHLSKVKVEFTPPSRLKSFDAWSQFIKNGKPA